MNSLASKDIWVWDQWSDNSQSWGPVIYNSFTYAFLLPSQPNLKNTSPRMFLVQRRLSLSSHLSVTWHGCRMWAGVFLMAMWLENADLYLLLEGRQMKLVLEVRLIQFQNPLHMERWFLLFLFNLVDYLFSNLKINHLLEEWNVLFCFMRLCTPMLNAFHFLQEGHIQYW